MEMALGPLTIPPFAVSMMLKALSVEGNRGTPREEGVSLSS